MAAEGARRAASALHPATRVGLWTIFAVALPLAGWLPLALITLAAAALLAAAPQARVLPMLRRVRWLLLSLLLIYAFATPGAALAPGWEALPVSREGLIAGLLQAWRIALIVAALALLMAWTSRDELLSGLHALLRPLRSLGVDPERIAVRLWLTLHYAERIMAEPAAGWRERLAGALEPGTEPPATVTLARYGCGWRDAAAVALALALALAGALW